MSPERRERDRRELARRAPIERRQRIAAAIAELNAERRQRDRREAQRVNQWIARFDAVRAAHSQKEA